jgi:hypothetical protein
MKDSTARARVGGVAGGQGGRTRAQRVAVVHGVAEETVHLVPHGAAGPSPKASPLAVRRGPIRLKASIHTAPATTAGLAGLDVALLGLEPANRWRDNVSVLHTPMGKQVPWPSRAIGVSRCS